MLGNELDHPSRIGKVILALSRRNTRVPRTRIVKSPVVLAIEHALDLARAADRLQLVV